MAEEPIDHVMRTQPPWDDTITTECGKAEVRGRVLTRAEFAAKVKKQGQQRSALTTCMTCWNTAQRYQPWEVSPTDCMDRWVGSMYGRAPYGNGESRDTQLRAIAALIEAHREEYDGYIAGVADTEDLAAHRRARQERTQTTLRSL